jgi:hypothetical protein
LRPHIVEGFFPYAGIVYRVVTNGIVETVPVMNVKRMPDS